MTTFPTVSARVAAGAAWLDVHEPGWVDRINLDRLQLDNCGRCVLGQLYGDFSEATDARSGGLTTYETYAFGFDIAGDPRHATDDAEFDALTAAWRELIQDRLRGAAAGPVAEEGGTRLLAAGRLRDNGHRISIRITGPTGEQATAYAIACAEQDGLWELHLGNGGWSLVDRRTAKRRLVRVAITGGVCGTCSAPKGRWRVDDPLYRPDGVDCPGCIRAACAEEADWKRRSDA